MAGLYFHPFRFVLPIPIFGDGKKESPVLQRLFTTFADGWPGLGLLLQRLLAAIVLFHYDIALVRTSTGIATVMPQIIGAGACVLLLLGLWTPLAGTLFALIELWIALAHSGDPWISITLATLGATLAMIGPGAWSIDARLFGRKRIDTRERNTSPIPPKS